MTDRAAYRKATIGARQRLASRLQAHQLGDLKPQIRISAAAAGKNCDLRVRGRAEAAEAPLYSNPATPDSQAPSATATSTEPTKHVASHIRRRVKKRQSKWLQARQEEKKKRKERSSPQSVEADGMAIALLALAVTITLLTFLFYQQYHDVLGSVFGLKIIDKL